MTTTNNTTTNGYIETRPEAIAAIHKSISHWNDICYGDEDDYYSDSCALCEKYEFCFGCPVLESTGKCSHDGTPWDGYWEAQNGEFCVCCRVDAADAAEAMLEALVQLLPESERVIYGG